MHAYIKILYYNYVNSISQCFNTRNFITERQIVNWITYKSDHLFFTLTK